MKTYKRDILGFILALFAASLLLFAHYASANPKEGTTIWYQLHGKDYKTEWRQVNAGDWYYFDLKKNDGIPGPDHVFIDGRSRNLNYITLTDVDPTASVANPTVCVETKPQMVRRLVAQSIQESWKNHGPLDWTAKWQKKYVIRYTVNDQGQMHFKLGTATTQFQTLAFYSQADAQLVLKEHGDDLLWVLQL